MKTDAEYQAAAELEWERREQHRKDEFIQSHAAQNKAADERREWHETTCRKHGLPLHATPRQIADCEIAYDHGWRSHVATRFAGSARTSHVLDPENSGHTDRAKIDELHALQAKLRKEFETFWPPAGLAERIMSATDSAQQGRAHNVGVAA